MNHNSILRDSHEAVKNFSWETIWLELQLKVPTLVNLLEQLLPKSSKHLLCFIICTILKKRSPHMALMQRTISIMLYAKGCNKQVNVIYPITISIVKYFAVGIQMFTAIDDMFIE